jgi:hypothetical protein
MGDRTKLSDLLQDVGLISTEANIGTELLGDLQSIVTNIGDDDSSGTAGLCNEQVHESNGASSENKNARAGTDVTTLAGVNTDRERLQKSTLIQ